MWMLLALACSAPEFVPWDEIVVVDAEGRELPDYDRREIERFARMADYEGSWISTIVLTPKEDLEEGGAVLASWHPSAGELHLLEDRDPWYQSTWFGLCLALEDQHDLARAWGMDEEDVPNQGHLETYGIEDHREAFALQCFQPLVFPLGRARVEVCGQGEMDEVARAAHELVFSEVLADEVVIVEDGPQWTWEELALPDELRIQDWTVHGDEVLLVTSERDHYPRQISAWTWTQDQGLRQRLAPVDISPWFGEERSVRPHFIGEDTVILADQPVLVGEDEWPQVWVGLDLDTGALTGGEWDDHARVYGYAAHGDLGWGLLHEDDVQGDLSEDVLVQVDLSTGERTLLADPGPEEAPPRWLTGVVDDQLVTLAVYDAWVEGSWVLDVESQTWAERPRPLPRSEATASLPLDEDRWFLPWSERDPSYPFDETLGWAVHDATRREVHQSPDACADMPSSTSYRASEGRVWALSSPPESVSRRLGVLEP